jgi:ferredoxin-type protein NapH
MEGAAMRWLLAAALTGFYLLLYRSEALTKPAQTLGFLNKWSLYGALYTVAVLLGGAFVIRRYRRNRYIVIRTLAAMAVQTTLAFAVPRALRAAGQPDYYFSYFWPLKFEYGTPAYLEHLPIGYVVYGILGSLVLVPLLALVVGKRWYCSWVCGCGALANTAGEPFRHLSSKSSRAWRIEKISIHTVLAACLLLTGLLIASWIAGDRSPALSRFAHGFEGWYAVIVSTWLSGIAGVGLYPLAGTRVWCRFFCPMAALLGLTQKAGRYRIAVKPDMCISCGMCSKYCEMGIDVRAYAQKNANFTRASCVGCGLCAEVCPRGVLRLENVYNRDLVRIRTT